MPPAIEQAESVIRFGAFELDATRGELRRDGDPIRLPPQPFKVLAVLASHPGRLTSREEIQQQVWGEGTFVDFELGLNYCLNQIRRALGDDPRTPHYVETIPRRGYRFIAPVVRVPAAERASPANSPSVAVLPFANLSTDERNAYFCDGLADEIITALTRLEGLRVTARTSSFAFRGKETDVREIGRKLGVRALLEGSVQKWGTRLRISAQLVSVEDGFHLWSEHYDCRMADVFAIQDQIARGIARALEVHLAPASVHQTTPNLTAYNCWLKARHYRHCESLSALSKCRACLDQAIALDPAFAQPYVTLADLFLLLPEFGLVSAREAIMQGREAIDKARKLDDGSGELHAIAGAYRAWEYFDWEGARADFDRALHLASTSERVHTLRANYLLVPTGQVAEAEREMESALELDPLSPLAYIELVKVILWERDFDRAKARMETAFDLWPEYPLAKWYMGVALYFQRRLEEALALWEPAMRKIGPNPAMTAAIGMAMGELGRHQEARRVLAEIESAGRNSYISSLSRAQVHVGLGEFDAAMELLANAVQERDPHILELPHKPIWDCLRNDERFADLLRRMRLQ